MAFFQYTLIGAIAAATHYAVLLALVEILRFPAALAAASGASVGAAVSYLGNRKLAFAGSTVPHHEAVPRFIVVGGGAAALSGSMVWAGTAIGIHYLLAQASATAVALAFTYGLNRRWTFS